MIEIILGKKQEPLGKTGPDEVDEFIINTYFTALNARNAYIPEFRFNEYDEVRNLMNSINKIQELKVVYGSYYDT